MRIFIYFNLLFIFPIYLYGAANPILLTGSPGGVYYPTGKALIKAFNQNKASSKLLQVKTSPGSVFNINAISNQSASFAFVQADKLYQAINGFNDWKYKGKQKNLRIIMNLHHESITLVTLKDSKIQQIKDIKGKHINIGNPGSGQRGNAIDIIQALGLDWKQDINSENKKAEDAHNLLISSEIDAYFHTVGHPCSFIAEDKSNKIKMLPISDLNQLKKKQPYLKTTWISKDSYPNLKMTKDMKTLGLYSVLISHSEVSEQEVYNLTKWMMEHIETLKSFHPAWKNLKQKTMLDIQTKNIHPGSLKYYKEQGLK